MRPDIYRDSIAQADVQLNMYDVRNEPVRLHRPGPVDSVESMQAKLNREAFTRLFARHADGPLLIVGQVGKYIVLAIVLPPYIFMYGIPKWLLTRAAPNVAKILGKLSEHSGKILMMISAFGNRQLNRVYQTLLLRVNMIKQRIIRRAEKFFAPFIAVAHALHKGTAIFARPFYQMGQAVANQIQSAGRVIKNIADKTGAMLRRIALMPTHGFEVVTNRMKQFYHSARQVLTPAVVAVVNAAKKGVERAANLVSKVVELPVQAFGKAAQAVNEYAVQPTIAWMTTKVNTANEVCLRTFNQVKEAVQHQLNRVLGKALQALDIASKVVTTCAHVLNHVFVRAPVQFMVWLTAPLMERSLSRLKHLYRKAEHIAHKVAHFASRTAARCRRALAKPFKKIAEKTKEFLGFAKKKLLWWKSKVKTVPQQCVHYAKHSAWLLRSLLRQLLYVLRRLIAWSVAMIRYSFQLASEVIAGFNERLNT